MPQLVGYSLALTKLGPFGTLGGGGAGNGPPEITVNAVNFDGTNDYLTRGDGLTGESNTKEGSWSIWFKPTADDATYVLTSRLIGAIGRGIINRLSDNKFQVDFQDVNENIVWRGRSNATILAAGGWVNVLGSVDSATGARSMYINDTLATLAIDTFNADVLIGWIADDWAIGAQVNGNTKSAADIAELWIDKTFIDFSVESNRRKFISAGGKPVDLESDGSGPTGTAPLIYQSGATATWHTNDGSGGGFTENGALTDASSSPSD